MKFVLAPDSFKQSMTSQQAINAMKKGIQSVAPQSEIIEVPMADGGEGTVSSLVHATNGHFINTSVLNPMREKVHARYGMLGNGKTAVIEMSAASGIQFTSLGHMVPMTGTTYGTGQLILNALDHHVNKIIIGLGGSATTDGGQGMADALGVKFYDQNHHLLPANGGEILSKINSIDTQNMDPRLKHVQIQIASDVSNPLTGKNGAAYVFARQKGANHEMIKQLDHNLNHYAYILKTFLHENIANQVGAGAAGGLGAGLLAFTSAKIESGVKIVINENKLKQHLINSDVVITGEGSIDSQTQYGKAPVGISQSAKEVAPKALVIALGGHIGKNIEPLYHMGIDSILSIVPSACSLEDAMSNGPINLEITVANIVRLLQKQNNLLLNNK